MVSKLAKLRFVILTLFLLILVIASLAFRNFTYKPKANIAPPAGRWTLEAIAGKELNGEKLQRLKNTEAALRQDIRLVAEVEEIKNSGSKIAPDKVLDDLYQKEFGTALQSVLPGQVESSAEAAQELQVKGASSNNAAAPTIGKRDLPTIDGYNVDAFTGSASLSYPISLPPARGNLSISLGLNYSSRTIDELRLNKAGLKEKTSPAGLKWGYDPKKTKTWEENIFADSSSPVGLGWNLSSFGAITVDPDRDDEFMLQLNGQAIRIKWDKTANTYKTYPDDKIKLERIGDLGAWKVTDTSGTVYLFGSVEGERHSDSSVEPARTGSGYQHLALSPMSANEYTVKTFRGNEGTLHCANDKILKWNLAKISDIHGNTAEIDYEQEILEVFNYPGTYSKCQYTAAIRLKTIKYNWDANANKYLTSVTFNYQDAKGVGSPYYDIYQTKGVWKPELQALTAPVTANNKVLSSIETRNDAVLLSRFEFSYTKSAKNPNIKFACPDIPDSLKIKYQRGEYQDYCARDETGAGERARQLLLTKVTVKGFNGQGEKRPQTYCYQSLKNNANPQVCAGTDTNIQSSTDTPNDLYLTRADNGYGGQVSYEYEKADKIDRICFNWRRMNYGGLDKNWRKICTDPNGYVGPEMRKDNYTAFYRVKKTVADNGMNKRKATEYTYLGQSQGYGANYSIADGLGYSAVTGLQFLGYPTVRIKSYDQQTGKVLSYVEQKTTPFLETGSGSSVPATEATITNACFMVDPRRGQVFESNVLNEAGAVIGFTKTDIRVRPNLGCTLPNLNDQVNRDLTDASKGWIVFEPYTKGTVSEIDGKKSQKETAYDFEVYPNDPTRNFGNVVKSTDYGNPDIAGDEVYSYTSYIQDLAKTAPQAYPDLNSYLAKNLIGLVGETFVSEENKASPGDVPQNKRLNWQTIKYDERLSSWGYQAGTSGIRGLPSTSTSIIIGTSAEKPDERIDVSTLSDYNQYGFPTKQTAANGTPATTYYDDSYHLFPVCQVQWKVNAADPIVSQPIAQACDINNNKDKKMVTRSYFDSQQSLARGLVDRIQDANGAVSKMEYDEYGRVTKTYQADKDTGQPETKPLAQAQYFDFLSPMRSRIAQRVSTDAGDNWQRIDTFYDGFGNEVQKLTYDLEDKDGKYAMLDVKYFNGIGQVEEEIKQIPIRNLAVPDQPAAIAQGVIDGQKNTATITDTSYDFFSRPTVVKTTAGGPYGPPIVSTTRTVYDGYKIHSFGNAGNQNSVEVSGLKTITTSYLCASDRNCTASTGQPVATETTSSILGKSVASKDARGITVSQTVYNSQGSPLKETDLDRGSTGYYYDNLGRLAQVKDAAGNLSKSTRFDSLDRVTQSELVQAGKTVADSVIDTVYDTPYIGKVGKIAMRKAGFLQKQTLTYDFSGRPTETQDDFDLSKYVTGENIISTKKTSTVSSTGLPLTSRYAVNGTVVDKIAYQYDAAGKLKGASDSLSGNAPLVKNLVYDFKGSLLSLGYDNSIQAVNEYDNSGRTAKKTVKKADSILFLQSSTFDPITQLLVKIDTRSQNAPDTSTQVRYDSFSRIAAVTGSDYTGNYAFDKTNNLLVKDEKTPDQTLNKSQAQNLFFTDGYAKDGDNPCAADSQYRQITKYDPAVNSCPYHAAKQSVVNGEVHIYLYDKKGNLTNEYTPDGKKIRDYVYDAASLPVKIVDYDTNGSTKLQEEYIYGIGGARLAKIDAKTKNYNLYLGSYEKKKDKTGFSETVSMDVPLAAILKVKKGNGSWVKNYTYANNQGSTAFILDAQGQYLPEFQDGARYFRYFAYGAQINNINLANLPRENTYTGQKKDASTGLMYYNARYYDPDTGLFQQADPADDGLNRYGYVGGNPIMMTDPSGKFINIIVGALIGGGADIAGQMVGGMIQGKSFKEAAQNINWVEVGLSAVVGGATSGLSAASAFGAGVGGQVARIAVSSAVDVAGNIAIQATAGGGFDMDRVNWTSVAVSVPFSILGNGGAEAAGRALKSSAVAVKVAELSDSYRSMVIRLYNVGRDAISLPGDMNEAVLHPFQQAALDTLKRGGSIGTVRQQALEYFEKAKIPVKFTELEDGIVEQLEVIRPKSLFRKEQLGILINSDVPNYKAVDGMLHGGGHIADFEKFPGITLRQTEARQWSFSAKYYEAIGQADTALRKLDASRLIKYGTDRY